ncbi:MAG: enoyl-CoA hydratase/isomerase family protein, partial [Anaerolineales bacterium]|nr:enoyl-CoA hydratase/isomerase family protein [Anaerolineales bacterium]
AVGFITLNRPPANSLEISFMRELDAAIVTANDAVEVKAIVVKSASEKFFSVGADIKAFHANDVADNVQLIHVSHQTLNKIATSEKIFIAAINGYALGGGFEVALACDLRFAAEGSYTIGLPEVTLGLLPGAGGTQRLSRLIGNNLALELMITGERVSPEKALELGIVNRLFQAGKLLAATEAFARRLTEGATVAIGAIKQAVHRGTDSGLSAGLALERDLIEMLFNTDDAQEGFAAFTEKRPPVFRGS